MSPTPIRELMRGLDPLANEVLSALLSHAEEDLLVDYKSAVDHNREKAWLDLTVDAVSFANTDGGYIVFGVENGTWRRIGLSESDACEIDDPPKVMDRLNRHIDPGLLSVRCRRHVSDGMTHVIWYVPESRGGTHIIRHDAMLKHLSGKEIPFYLRKGTIYVRRSGGHVAIEDAAAFENLIEKRLRDYKTELFSKIARVVEAPAAHKVVMLTEVERSDGKPGYMISDSSDPAIETGRIFSTSTPTTDVEVLDVWISLKAAMPEFLPPRPALWQFYLKREQLSLSETQRLELARFSMITGLPSFFWLQGIAPSKSEQILENAVVSAKDSSAVDLILRMAALIGEGTYGGVARKAGARALYSTAAIKQILKGHSRSLYGGTLIANLQGDMNDTEFRSWLRPKLDESASSLHESPHDAMELRRAREFDCYLYFQVEET